MEKQYDIIKFESNVPLKLRYLHLGELNRRWNKGLTILLVLKGRVTLLCDDKSLLLSEDDLFVVNANAAYAAHSDDAALVSLQIDTDKLPRRISAYFDCNSASDNDKGRYYKIKHLIAELVKKNSGQSNASYYYNISAIYSILYELNENFTGSRTENPTTQKYLARLDRIVRYIDEHYSENLTLNTLADFEHLSVPYLSAFLEKYLGVSFTAYYNRIRLEHAVNELLVSDDSIETIAFHNGFSDPRSFVNLFKKKYGTLPSLYRKNPPEAGRVVEKQSATIRDNEQLFQESALLILAKYLPDPRTEPLEAKGFGGDIKIINKEKISMMRGETVLKHTFKVFTSVSRARDILYADVQKMLVQLQKDIGYEYIKFHGLLSDDMLVYKEDTAGDPHYSFVHIDKVLDFLLSIDLKPLIQLSFMPEDLASEPERNVYAAPFNISPPKSLQKWTELIAAFMRHIIERYSAKTVKNWLFCVWNEPDTTVNLFGFPCETEFYRFYQATYDTVKSFGKSFRFGSPSLLISYHINMEWLSRFIKWCHQNDCVPDFMNIHYYDNDFSDDSIEQHRPAQPAHSRLNRDENSFRKCVSRLKIAFNNLGIGGLPVYLTEWNLTVSHRNLLNDTCFKSCYLTKNLLENYDELDSFGYWVLTDFIEELQPAKEEFHGGLGLFTTNGIKKPHYYVFEFLNRLGNRLIERGEGYFITKSYGAVQILLYNYEHFNHLFASGELFDMTFTERYTPFSQLGKMDISLELTDIPVRRCLIRESIVNQASGSAFDEWVRMGSPKLTTREIDYLKHISIPKMYVRETEIENGALPINAALEPLEVRLIEVLLK